MPDMQLHDYLARVDDWIRSGEQDQAIAHSRHLLSYCPECIQVHRRLGEAYLEKGTYSDAQACFERVLAADPESAISHYGLGLICDRQGMLPEAIRHLERAFDLASGNAEVRSELQKLYVRRGGAPSDGPALTSAAMGRVYAHNGLLERAIAEYQDASRQNPELLDVRAALAEAQWRAGRSREATDTCMDLLDRLPGCLKAHLILGELLRRDGQETEADARLAVAQALDPENRLAQEMMGERSPLPPRKVLVPELEAEHGGESGPSEEALTLPEREVSPITPVESAQAVAATAAAPALKAEQVQPEAVEASASSSGADLAAAEATPQEAPADATPVGALPEWLDESPAEVPPSVAPAGGETVPEEAPGWMEPWDATRAAEPAAQPKEEGAPAEEPAVPEPPAWMAELAEQPAAAEETAQAEPVAKAVSGPEEPAALGSPGSSLAPVAEEVPDWVRHMEEAVAQEGALAGAEALSEATSAAVAPGLVPSAIAPTAGGEAGCQRIRERIERIGVQLQAEPRKYWARIEMARLCCQVRDWEGALLHYEELIASRRMVRAAIHDLQSLLQEEVDKVQVYRLLGDAYMESDEIDQALEMYRLARQILRKR